VLDLKNPDHKAALRYVASEAKDMTREQIEDWRAKFGILPTLSPAIPASLDALLIPEVAADLIRQLVERAGCTAYAYLYAADEPDEEDGMDSAFVFTAFREPAEIWWFFEYEDEDDEENNIQMSDAPALITSLLALSPNAGAEAVLDALRGNS
jgi:hypothetical protein